MRPEASIGRRGEGPNIKLSTTFYSEESPATLYHRSIKDKSTVNVPVFPWQSLGVQMQAETQALHDYATVPYTA